MMRTGSTHQLLPRHGTWHLYLRGGAGVGSMTKIYGGRQRNGVMPSHFSRGSKSVARRVLQALEGLKMVEKDQDGGRKLTPQGGSTPLLCLEGVPDLPLAAQDEAGLTKTFQTWPRGWFHIP